jgi:hypothetical protein
MTLSLRAARVMLSVSWSQVAVIPSISLIAAVTPLTHDAQHR